MTRDDLYGYYKQLLRPEQRDAGHRRRRRRGRRAAARRAALRQDSPRARCRRGSTTVEPEQTGERRVTIRKPGTTAYLKVAYHAPAVDDREFYPLLVLDAALTGA